MLLRKVAPIMVGFSMALWTNTALNSNKSARTKITNTQNTLSLSSFQSEYKMKWHRVEMDHSQFSLVGRHNSKVVGGYETRAGHSVFGIPIGANQIDVTRIYGLPLRAIHYQSTSYLLDYNDCDGNTTHGTYLIDGHYVTFTMIYTKTILFVLLFGLMPKPNLVNLVIMVSLLMNYE